MRLSQRHNQLMLLVVYILTCILVPNSKLNGQTSTPTEIPAGTVAKDRYGFEMVYVPQGTVQMGISTDRYREVYRELFSIADPQTYVNIEGQDGIFDTYNALIGGFWIDRYEVTIEQYGKRMQECIGTGACQQLDWLATTEPSLVDNPQKPQVGVPWYDALRFCDSREARLPTEQEWEYAAIGVEKYVFPWGNDKRSENVLFQAGTYP